MLSVLRASWLALLLVGFSVLANPAGAVQRVEPKGGAIMGIVVDDAGEPVAGAIVAILNKEGNPIRHTHTGPGGKFGFKHVLPGERHLKAAKKEVGFGGTAVKVEPEQVAKAKIVLKKK